MASSLSAFSLSTPNSPLRPSSYTHLTAHKFQFHCVQLRTQFKSSAVSSMVKFSNNSAFRATKVRAVTEEEEILVPEEGEAESVADQTVSVSVSSSDVLTMFFQAEGTMSDSAIPAVTKGLEVVDGIADLKVQVLEGIASVELKKQTTVQATGVASNLVEIIQGSGFKLQTLNLSFQDEEDFA